MHPQTASWLEDLESLDSDNDTSPDVPVTEFTATPCPVARSQSSFSFASLPIEVAANVVDMLTLPATASLMQTCKHLRSLCMNIHTWEAHSGEFRAIQDKARTHYRLRDSQPATAEPPFVSVASVDPARLAEAANWQRFSWSPVPGELYTRRVFSSGDKVATPAWLSLMPHVSSQNSTWLYVKTKTLAGNVIVLPVCSPPTCSVQIVRAIVPNSESTLKGCQPSFQHTHNSVRPQLYTLWLTGEVKDGLLLQRMLLKLTRLSWSKTYETMGNAFTHAADCIALDLRTDFLTSKPSDQQTRPCSGTVQIWQAVLRDWHDYKTWLTKACSLGVRLGECISAERAAELMSRGTADTPTLFDVGKAAFRSQVVLAYGLRVQLQTAWQQLRLAAKLDDQSADDAHVMLDVTRLLQELDVADDGTKPSTHHTQEQMREAFGLQDYRHEFARTLLQLK